MWAKVANAFKRGDGAFGETTLVQSQYQEERTSHDEVRYRDFYQEVLIEI